MKQNELKKVLAFYNDVILQQIIKPQEIEEIYRYVNPNGAAVPYYKKMRDITIYVQSLKQSVVDGVQELILEVDDIPDTSNPMSADFIDPDGLPTLTEEELEIPLVWNREAAAAVQMDSTETSAPVENKEILEEVHVLKHKGQSHHEDNAPQDYSEDYDTPLLAEGELPTPTMEDFHWHDQEAAEKYSGLMQGGGVEAPATDDGGLSEAQKAYDEAQTPNEKRSWKQKINRINKQRDASK